MTIPLPNPNRTVGLYSRAQMMSMRAPLQWQPKHPLAQDWWWLDATNWLCDSTGTPWDTIGQIAYTSSLTDGALSIVKTAISADGLHAGFLLNGGTPGMVTTIRCVLTTVISIRQESIDIVLKIDDVAPVVANPPNVGTLHGSYVTIGGFPFPLS